MSWIRMMPNLKTKVENNSNLIINISDLFIYCKAYIVKHVCYCSFLVVNNSSKTLKFFFFQEFDPQNILTTFERQNVPRTLSIKIKISIRQTSESIIDDNFNPLNFLVDVSCVHLRYLQLCYGQNEKTDRGGNDW